MIQLRDNYKKEKKIRKTDLTIYVQVQELTFVGVIDDDYEVFCPTADGVEKYEHNCDSCDKYPCWDEDKYEDEPDRCEHEVKCGYVWYPIDFFFTMEAAREFIRYDKRNLRTYTSYVNERNFEIKGVLKHLGLGK